MNEEQIKQAQHNPFYKTIYDLIGDANNLDDAIANMRSNVNGQYPTNDLEAFLTKNQFAFWTENGTRIPLADIDTSKIKFGLQGGNKTNTKSKAVPDENLKTFDKLEKERGNEAEKVTNNTDVLESKGETISNKKAKQKKDKNKKYESKGTGGRKQRVQQKKQEKIKREIENEQIKQEQQTNKNNAEINADSSQPETKNPIYKTPEEIMGDETLDDFKKRADDILNDSIHKKEVNNKIDSIFDIINGAKDERELQKRISNYGKKSGYSKEKREEMHNFIHENADDILERIKEESKEKATEGIEKGAKESIEKGTKEGIEELGESNLKKIFNKRAMGVLFSGAFAISDYKTAREEGKGVVRSALKAGVQFAEGEILGAAMIPIGLAKAAPMMAIKGVETAQTMTRQMNSVQRLQTFGNTTFQDTQQLATMRQSGMELAKMSQYNLQQSIMGNEAQYMHR